MKALLKFRCSNSWTARCEPQPGQSNPVADLKGHDGKNGFSAGLKKKYAAPKIKIMATEIIMGSFFFIVNGFRLKNG